MSIKTLGADKKRYRVTLEVDVWADCPNDALPIARRHWKDGENDEFCVECVERIRRVQPNGDEI